MASPYDATFSASGHGSRTAYCTSLDWGTRIEGEETESRSYSTFYPKRVTTSSFSIEISFSKFSTWQEFMKWMQSYVSKASNPSGTIGPMAVYVPQRSFSRVGIPVSGFAYGDNPREIVRRSKIYFEGASDPLKPGDTGTSSEPGYTLDSVVEKFYPTGDQVDEDSLYNAEDGYFRLIPFISDGGNNSIGSLIPSFGGG